MTTEALQLLKDIREQLRSHAYDPMPDDGLPPDPADVHPAQFAAADCIAQIDRFLLDVRIQEGVIV